MKVEKSETTQDPTQTWSHLVTNSHHHSTRGKTKITPHFKIPYVPLFNCRRPYKEMRIGISETEPSYT